MYNSRVCVKIFNIVLLMHLVVAQQITTTVHNPVATTELTTITSTPQSRYEKDLVDYEDEQVNFRRGKGMMSMDYDDHHHDDHYEHMSEEKAVKNDPWEGYYDFLINEGSFKFWAVFQLVTALVLTYAAFAAVYYAKFNVIAPDYDYYDGFFGRSDSGTPPSDSPWLGLDSQTFQRILNALSSKKYT